MTWRFVGTESEIAGHSKLMQFGQSIDLPDSMRAEALAAQCIPDKDFGALGLDPDELKRHANPGTHAQAPASFLSKKRAALIRLHELRTAAEPASTPQKGGKD